MALSARFEADFKSFYAAVQQAEVSLRSFETGAGKAEASLNRMTDSFSGRRVIQEATLMAEAVQRSGGASTLTARELATVGAKAAEAAEKMRALGMEVPKNVQALANLTNAAKPAQQQTSFLSGAFATLTASFTAAALITRATSALTSWASEAISSAGQTLDLANKTGLSTKTIQQMAYVADQTGGSLEGFTKAAFQLGARLAGGETSVQGAVMKLGLSLRDLQQMSPDAQFQAIIRGLEGMESPQERNRVAIDLFGKSAEQILPAVAEGYSKIADQARISSDAQLQAVDRATDAWAQFVKNSKTAITSFVGTHIMATQEIGNLTDEQREQYRRLLVTGQNTTKFLAEAAEKRMAAEEAVAPAIKANTEASVDYEKVIAAQASAEREAAAAAKKLAEAKAELASSGEGWRGTLEKINDATVRAVRGYLEAGVSQSALATVYNLTATQVKAVASALAEEEKAHKAAEAAAKKAVETKQRGLDELAKLEATYIEAVARNSVSRVDIELAQNDRMLAGIVARLNKAGVEESNYAELVKRLSQEMTEAVMVDTNALRAHSRTALEEKAAKAEATYRAAIANSGEYSAAAIRHFRELAIEANKAAASWGQSFDVAGDRILDKAKAVFEGVRTYTEQMIASVMPLQKLSDADVEKMGGERMLRKRLAEIEAYYAVNPGARASGSGQTGIAPGDEAGYRRLLEMQVVYAQIKQYLDSLGRRAMGGPVSAGESYIVGEKGPEIFTPKVSGAISPNGAGGYVFAPVVTINGAMMSAPAEIARMVKQALVESARGMGQRLPVGAG